MRYDRWENFRVGRIDNERLRLAPLVKEVGDLWRSFNGKNKNHIFLNRYLRNKCAYSPIKPVCKIRHQTKLPDELIDT